MVQVPVILMAGMAGVWLFYVQHQFDPSYWARHEEWGSIEAAMQGSSYYRLPRVLQWVSGNIGLHHVHHLKPRIPNYHLQKCLDAIPELQLQGLPHARGGASGRSGSTSGTRRGHTDRIRRVFAASARQAA